MAYITRSALEAHVGSQLILDLTDDEKIGASNPLCDIRINAIIATVDSVIDAHLRARFKVPVSPVPAFIAHISEHLSLYHLHLRRAQGLELPEYVKELHRESMQLLSALRKGEIDPGTEPLPATSSGEIAQAVSLDADGNKVAAPPHLFTPDTLKES